MRSVQFDRFGNATEVLTVEDVPIPEPGEGEVRVKVAARPIHPSDLMYIRGTYGLRPPLPAVPGFEGAGSVDAVGPGVDVPLGQRVVFAGRGTWQQYVVVPSDRVFAVPEGVSDDVACQSFVNPFTAMALLEELNLPEGAWLLVTAAAGSMGQILLDLANQFGLKTICTVRRYDQIFKLRKLGAAGVIDTETEHIYDRVMEITQRQGVNAVLDAVGGKIGGQALSSLTNQGTMIIYGSLAKEETPMLNREVIFKSLTVKGFWLAEWVHNAEKAKIEQAYKMVVEMISSGRFAPQIASTYDLVDVEDAVRDAQRPGRSGKIVLTG